MRGKGIIDIYILEILARCSSAEHRLRQTDIMKYLDRDYNLTIGRNTLSGYIRELKREHYIEGDRGIVNPYYIVVEKSRYYLLCYAGRQDIEPRRIDSIKSQAKLN